MGYTVEFHIVRKSQSYTKWADEQLILDSFLVHRERERDLEKYFRSAFDKRIYIGF